MGDAKRFGRYEVRDTIGRGAMGVVYLAEDPVIGRKVAIKVVEAHAGLEKDELVQLQARFEREFQSAGRLSHPNIVSVHDVGQEDGNAFIAMEYVKGESLAGVLAENRAFSFKEIADLTAQLASGLDYAHEFGIVHRDVKPANILITREGRPKITDFGVAKVATTTLTRTGTVVGTPAYMSPEQVTGHPVSGAADQFSLAVMIYQLLTGERPFTGENPTTIMYKIVHEAPVPPSVLNAMVPGPVDKALIRALSKNPGERYPLCMDLAEALRATLGAAPTDATVAMSTGHTEATVVDRSLQRPAPPSKSAPKGQGARVLGLAAAGVAVIGLAIAGWAYSMGAFTIGGADSAEPAAIEAAPAPAEITQQLTVSAGAGWEVWLDGSNTGVVAPGAISLTGMPGDEVAVELRYGGLEPISARFTLGDDTPADWAPQDAAMEPATLVAAEPVAEPPAAEPPVAFTIVSNPAGARVTFDGEVLDERTPVQVEIDLAEVHTVEVDLPGYDTSSWRFGREQLNEGHLQSRELLFALTSSIPPGFVAINNPGYPVAVTLTPLGGGNPIGSSAATSHELRVPPGRYAVELSAPEVHWRSERQTITVESDLTQVISNIPRAVTVQVSGVPGNCVVSIDGTVVGPAPLTVQVAVGSHIFKFDWSEMGRGSKDVTVSVNTNNQRIVAEAPGRP